MSEIFNVTSLTQTTERFLALLKQLSKTSIYRYQIVVNIPHAVQQPNITVPTNILSTSVETKV